MIRTIVRGMLTKIVVALINFGILFISLRYLGVASRGEISLFLLNVALVQLVNEVYTGYGLVHFIPRFNIAKTMLTGLVFTAIVTPLFYYGIVAAGYGVVGFESWGLVVAILVVLNTFNCVLLLGREHVKAYHALYVLQPALLLMGMCWCIFVKGNFTFASFFWPLLLSFLIAFSVSSFLVARISGTGTNNFKISPVLLNGVMYQGATILFILTNRLSYYLFPAIQEVGLYSAASSIMDAVLVLASSVFPVLIARVANQGDSADSAALALSLGKISFVFTLCCVVCVFLLPASFFTSLLGKDYAQLRSVMLAYAPAAMLLSFFLALSAYFSATGRQRIVLSGYGSGFVVTLLLAPVLIKKCSVHGAAISAGLSYLVIGVFLTVAFLRTTGISVHGLLFWRHEIRNLKLLIKGIKSTSK